MITKHDIGEKVCIVGTICAICLEEGKNTYYKIMVMQPGGLKGIIIAEEGDFSHNDYVTLETYETEVNELKSIIEEKNREIERLKGRSTNSDFSHHPQENIYAKSLENFDAEKERDKVGGCHD